MLKGQNMPITEMVELAQRAERAGYDSVWIPEFWRECFVPAAAVALGTSRIKIGSGIALAYARSPALTAQTVANIDEVAGGRFILGLGTGAFEPNEFWYDVREQRRRLTRRRDVAEIVKQYLAAKSGDEITYEGRAGSTRNFPLTFTPYRPRIPIYFGAIKPKSIEAAAEIADGVLTGALISLRYLDDVVIPSVRRGAERAGRPFEDVDVAGLVTCAIADDAAEAREMVRADVATYLPFEGIRDVFTLSGYAEEQKTAAEAFMRNDRDAVLAAVTDEMIDDVTLCGTPDHCREKLHALRRHMRLPVLLPAATSLSHEEISRNIDRMFQTFTGGEPVRAEGPALHT
jgi:alkanesulfonate monooxygenase SsuD/methylene tetrahydromethanopterin reductase-like flavin-dependent oxidoreductase (luciferase family)